MVTAKVVKNLGVNTGYSVVVGDRITNDFNKTTGEPMDMWGLTWGEYNSMFGKKSIKPEVSEINVATAIFMSKKEAEKIAKKLKKVV